LQGSKNEQNHTLDSPTSQEEQPPPTASSGSKLSKTADLGYQRSLFDELAKELGIQSHEDWYRVRYAQVKGKIGSGVMKRYDDSMISSLKSIYPEHEWLDWRFSSVPRYYWQNPRNARQFFEYVGSKSLGITDFTNPSEMEKWYQVGMKNFAECKGLFLSENYPKASS
jgi:hypothetical protein